MIDEPLLGNSLGIDISLGGLSELKEYYQAIERVLEETGKWQLATIDKRVEKLSIEKQQYYKDFYHPSRWITSFPSELRASIIISGMSFLESQLWQISLSAQYYSQEPFKKPKKNILSSYRKYLQEFGNLSIKNSHEWDMINNIYVLRNVLVHNGMDLGSEDDNSSMVEDIKNKVSGILLDQDGHYIIDKTLCIKMFDCIEFFLASVKHEVCIKWESN